SAWRDECHDARPMQTASRAFTIEQLDLPSAPEPLVAEVAALRNALQREYLPDDPPVPAAAIAARARARPKMFRMREWLARDAACGREPARPTRARSRSRARVERAPARGVPARVDRRRRAGCPRAQRYRRVRHDEHGAARRIRHGGLASHAGAHPRVGPLASRGRA